MTRSRQNTTSKVTSRIISVSITGLRTQKTLTRDPLGPWTPSDPDSPGFPWIKGIGQSEWEYWASCIEVCMFRCSEVRSSPVRPFCNPAQHKPRPHCRTCSDFHSKIKLSSLSFNLWPWPLSGFPSNTCYTNSGRAVQPEALRSFRSARLSYRTNRSLKWFLLKRLYTGRDGVNGLVELGQLNLTFMIFLKLWPMTSIFSGIALTCQRFGPCSVVGIETCFMRLTGLPGRPFSPFSHKHIFGCGHWNQNT